MNKVNYQEQSFNDVPINMPTTGLGPKGLKFLQSQFVELWYLLRIEFKNIRESWVWSVLMISLFPIDHHRVFKFFYGRSYKRNDYSSDYRNNGFSYHIDGHEYVCH